MVSCTGSYMDELSSIDIQSGVNEKGEGFLTIIAHAEKGKMFVGQMYPKQVRDMAMAWLESAEAAEQDAATLRVVRKLELPDQIAGMIITELRNSREG